MRLEHQWQAEVLDQRVDQSRRSEITEGIVRQCDPVRRVEACALDQGFRGGLVPGQPAVVRTGAQVRHSGQLENPLHCAVLTALPVQGDDCGIRLGVGEPGQQSRVGIPDGDLDALPPQRLGQPGARSERDLTLVSQPAGKYHHMTISHLEFQIPLVDVRQKASDRKDGDLRLHA